MRYYKSYIALSETCDVPVLLHVRNSRALCFDQLRELLSHEMLAVIVRSLRWRVARLEKVGLVARLSGVGVSSKLRETAGSCWQNKAVGCF